MSAVLAETPPTSALAPALEAARAAALAAGLSYAGSVAPRDAWALVQAGQATLVDVRSTEERKFVGHVPGVAHVAWATGTALTRNPRFVVTSLAGDASTLYEQLYCARGEAENRIKEAQIDLFGRRASCHKYQANQLRLLLAALAYTLMINLRRHALVGTALANACTATIRVQLLKIAAAIMRNTRRVRVMLASNHPMRATFASAARALAP